MSWHQPEGSCGVVQAPLISPVSVLLPWDLDPQEPDPTAWSWQSSSQPSKLRAIAPSRAPGCFAGTHPHEEANPERFGWWIWTQQAQQLSRETEDRAGYVSFQLWPPRVMAGAKLVWFQRRFKELLGAGRPAAGREKMKWAVPVWSIHVSLGYPVTTGLGDGSEPLEGHSHSSR